MAWTVLFQEDFAGEFAAFDDEVRTEMRAMVGHLAKFGPAAKRPQVDTLKGAKIANLKEFRFSVANGVWRVAFAFDAKRRAIVLAAGDKSGTSSNAFYKRLIKIAEKRMAKYEAAQKEAEE
ncbi:MAG: type II toxin-antitoxin system RelE/ParE family toxin [Micropepsaceae bacterium]